MLSNIQDDEFIVGDLIEEIMPKYLRREQFENCKLALTDLKEWSEDSFYHDLRAIHQVMLYKIFDKFIYQNKNLNILKSKDINFKILHIIQDHNLKKFNKFYSLKWYQKNIFKTNEFLLIEELYRNELLVNYLKKDPHFLNKYFEILPKRIQETFDSSHQKLEIKVTKLLKFINDLIEKKKLSELFWIKDIPMQETEIQVLLENIMDNYFYRQTLDITREALIGPGKIDFKFFSSSNEKVLLEVKKGKSSNLEQGYYKQIINYMKSWDCKSAFYLIICYTQSELNRANKLRQNVTFTDPLHYKIKIIILDVRKKEFLEKIDETKVLKSNDNEIDEIFKRINKNLEIKNIEEAKKKLKNIKKDYLRLSRKEEKERYIKRVQKIANDNIIKINHMEKLFKKDYFYEIISTNNSIVQFIFSRFILNQEPGIFLKNINDLINSWDSFTFNNKGNQVNELEMKEIFAYLIKNHPQFYELLTNIFVTIYLIDAINYIDNTMCIAYTGFRNYQILCYRTENKNYEFSYLFSYGFILYCLTMRFDKSKLTLFKEMFIKESKESIDSKNFIDIFVNTFTKYLVHGSKYESVESGILKEEYYKYFDSYFLQLIQDLNRLQKEKK